MDILYIIICFLASVVGAICGIGGGVIIKPILDAFGTMDVAIINFLSGCTVLAMSTYSVINSKVSKKTHIETKTGLPLAIGAALGGVAGRWLFSNLVALSTDKNKVSAVQAICLLIVMSGTLVYTVNKEKIYTYQVKNAGACILIGSLLGLLSSFLGIGGGPVNLVILFFFFSMNTKSAAENSLYIIFFSQMASFIVTVLTGNIAEFRWPVLVLMVAGGIVGGICGRAWNKKMEDKVVDKLFIVLTLVIILINIYNIIKYL